MQFIGTGDRILTENFNVGYLYTITFKTGIYINSACIGIGDNFVMFQKAEPDLLFTLNVDTANEVDTIELYDSGGGTNDYDDLANKPQINSHTLTGNMTGSDLGLQDTISDLDTIRSGAAAGATAVQPAALSDYQPVISDLDTIRAGAAAGATAVQPDALSDYQPVISDLDTIRAGAAAGATAVQPADMTTALATKQDALTTAQLTAVNSGITSTDVAQITTNKNNILSILGNGYKNKLNYKSGYVAGFTQTIGEVTFTINDDLSITANSNGNAVTTNRTFSIYNGLPFHVAGDIISGGVSSQCTVECELATNPYTNYGYSTGNAGTMTAATGTVEVFCRVKAGAAVNVTFYPMICDAGFYGASDTFEPFKTPNLRLVQDKKIMLKDDSITWRQSSAGLYYTDPIAIEGISNVVSVMLTQFAYLSDSNIIQVIGSPTAHNSVRFIANSDNINASAYVMVTVLGF